MSEETRKPDGSKDLRIDDLPPKAVSPEEQDNVKGGYSVRPPLFGGGILHDTLPQMTSDSSGNEVVDGT
jgi:hypothetical protein